MPTAEQWIDLLSVKLAAQQRHAREYDAYYTGTRRLQVVEDEYREVFGIIPQARDLLRLRPPDTNVAAVGVDALVERLQIEGFTAPVDSADPEAEKASRDVWTGMDLDVMQSVANTEALVKGRAYLLVGDGPDGAVVSAEDCEQVAVARSPEPPYDVMAGLKVYDDPWGGPRRGWLWLPGVRIELTARDGAGVLWTPGGAPQGPWTLGQETSLPGALGDIVPIAELSYRSRLLAEPRSYIQAVASLADSYALLMAYLVIAARYGAIPVRTMAGIKLPRDEVTGEPKPLGRVGSDRVLASENENARFGQLDAGQLAGFIAAIDMLLSSIVSITRVPQHYYGQGARSGTSGEMLKTSETGLVRRVLDTQRYLGTGYRKAASWAVSVELGRPVRLLPRWTDTETRVEAQAADATQKYVASQVPLDVALMRAGWPADLIQRAVKGAGAAQEQAALILAAVNARTGASVDTAALLPAA